MPLAVTSAFSNNSGKILANSVASSALTLKPSPIIAAAWLTLSRLFTIWSATAFKFSNTATSRPFPIFPMAWSASSALALASSIAKSISSSC